MLSLNNQLWYNVLLHHFGNLRVIPFKQGILISRKMFGLGMIVIFVKSEFSKNLSKLSKNFEENLIEEKLPILMYYLT